MDPVNLTIAFTTLAVAALGVFYARRQVKIAEAPSLPLPQKRVDNSWGRDDRFEIDSICIRHNKSYKSDKIPIQLKIIKGANEPRKAIYFCSGLGLDYRDFESHESYYPEYDLIFFTSFGFEQETTLKNQKLTFDDLSIIFAEFINVHSQGQYDDVTIVGFSIGADLLIHARNSNLLRSTTSHCIFLDPNIDGSSLFISNFLADFQKRSIKLQDVQMMVEKIEFSNLSEWANLHEYIVKICQKYQGTRSRFLARIARDVKEKYESMTLHDFCNLVFANIEVQSEVSIEFSNGINAKKVSKIKGILDERIRHCDQRTRKDHFDLIRDPVVVKNLITSKETPTL